MRKSFSLIITIVFIVVMSVIGVMILSFSTSSSVHTTRSFVDTRADLMLKSATEYAILALQGHSVSASNRCLDKIETGDDFFDVNITFHYFIDGNCSSAQWQGCHCSEISTPDTNGSVLIYVTVASKNQDFHIRKVRFTLQNP